jgi:iron complex transport system substrate-binding protein
VSPRAGRPLRLLWDGLPLAVLALALGAAQARAGAATGSDGLRVEVKAPQRVVSLGGGLTELAFAIGAGPQVVGTDASSTAPEAAATLPKVGYYRQASAEGILSLRPDLVVAHADTGPPAVLAQLRQAGLPVLVVDGTPSAPALLDRVALLGAVLEREAEAGKLRDGLRRQLEALPGPGGARPRVLFIYARGGGTLNVAGAGTAAHAMIELAGGENVLASQQGYLPLTAEAVVAARPDVLLLTTGGLQSLGGIDALRAVPGVAQTPAGRAGRVLTVDDLTLLGFGPRAPSAAAALHSQLQAAK